MAKPFPILGFDVGGTKVAVSLVLSDGTLVASSRVPNKEREPDDVLPAMVSAGKSLLADAGMTRDDLKAVGVCTPSPLDFKNGIVMAPSNLKKWKHVPIRDYLAEAFGVRAFFDNDSNASGLAEWLFGSGIGTQDMLYISISTGIGAGVIANGRLVRGATCDAGEVGHMVLDANGPLCNCGLRGCWEAFSGGRAIAQRMQRELANSPNCAVVQLAGGVIENIDMKTLSDAVEANDPYACGIWDEMMERHAQAIGMLHNIFNPSIIALGTIAIQCGDLFMKPLLERVKKYGWKQPREACSIVPGKLGPKLGEYAGAAVALYALHEIGEWELPWHAN